MLWLLDRPGAAVAFFVLADGAAQCCDEVAGLVVGGEASELAIATAQADGEGADIAGLQGDRCGPARARWGRTGTDLALFANGECHRGRVLDAEVAELA